MPDDETVAADQNNEQEIIRRVNSGEMDAYAGIVRVYQERMLRLSASLLGDFTGAEDATQDIFLKAYQSLPSFRGASSFSTWIHRIAVNHCKDLLRKSSRQKTQSLEVLTDQMGDAIEHLFLQATGPSEVSAEASERMERVLLRLSPHHRLILVLREADGLSYEEIAKALGCTVDGVKARLRRARAALDEKLRQVTNRGRSAERSGVGDRDVQVRAGRAGRRMVAS